MNFLILFTSIFLLTSCVSVPEPLTEKNSNLTQGNVQLSIKTGTTTKSDILEVFGAPNVTTRDGEGREVWTYQRQAQVNQAYGQEGGWSVLLIGKSTAVTGFESSSRMITLIIKFDSNDVVADFNSRASNF